MGLGNQIPSYRMQAAIYSNNRVQITEVDPGNNVVEAIDASRQSYQCYIGLFNSAITALPQVGEFWLISKMGQNWVLQGKYEDGNETTTLANMSPGDRRIEGSTLHLASDTPINFSPGSLDGTINGAALQLPLTLDVGTAVTNADVLYFQRNSDFQPKLTFTDRYNESDVVMSWGDGLGSPDVNLYRSGPGTLTVYGNLNITGNVSFGTAGGSPTYTVPYYVPNRTFNTGNTTLSEVANVLATLLADLGLASASTSTTQMVGTVLLTAGGGSPNTPQAGSPWTIYAPYSIPSGELFGFDVDGDGAIYIV